MPRTPGRATIIDVARTAGVSLSTVSRVMNGKANVDPALADRVRTAAAELGYTASPVARSLVLGRTQTVAVIIPDLANPTFQAILRGLSRAADDDGYHVLIADTAERVDLERTLAETTRRRTDGVILCAPRMAADDLAALLPQLAPAVVINRPPQEGTPTVAADYRSAMAALVDGLYADGHRHLVYLSGVVGSASGAARAAALDEARAAHPDLRIDEVPAGVDFDSGAAAASAVLDSGATGVLAFNDLVAMGLLSAVSGRGIRVPEDLSIAGFDDIPFAAFTTPPLTTAAVPAAELGRLAWAAMSAQLAGTSTSPGADAAADAGSGSVSGEGDAAASAHVVLTPDVVRRGSTGPAPR